MALSTRTTANSLGFNRFAKENEIPGKNVAGKGRIAAQRSALGELGNNHFAKTEQGGKAVKKEHGTYSKRTLAKNTATTSLKAIVEKENTKTQKQKKAASPAPMDISAREDAFSKAMLKFEDIDKNDHENPQLVSEYVNDIYEYMRQLEVEQCVRTGYLEGQAINPRMRAILVDWLIQVHLRFHLLQETLYMTIAVLDRFLQEKEVSRTKLQLVGVTSMLIASKYEEMYAPEIADFVYITDNAYSKSDIRKMECMILKTLDFNLGRPLPLHFLRRNSKAGQVDANVHTLAKYLMEMTLPEYSMVHIHPSQIAGAGLCLAMKVLQEDTWDDTLTHYSKYSEKELKPIMQKMAHLIVKSDTSKLTAVKSKYQSSKFMKISTIPQLKGRLVKELAELAVEQ